MYLIFFFFVIQIVILLWVKCGLNLPGMGRKKKTVYVFYVIISLYNSVGHLHFWFKKKRKVKPSFEKNGKNQWKFYRLHTINHWNCPPTSLPSQWHFNHNHRRTGRCGVLAIATWAAWFWAAQGRFILTKKKEEKEKEERRRKKRKGKREEKKGKKTWDRYGSVIPCLGFVRHCIQGP